MKYSRNEELNIIITIFTIFILIFGVFLPLVNADINIDFNEGFKKGVSWKPIVPMKKVTFVNSNSKNIIDDYAYLSSVPTSVFYDDKKERIFSNPLLFFQDEYISGKEKERSLNARQGIDYFMEDWLGYSNGNLDQITLINVPKEKLDKNWKYNDHLIIESDDPYEIASQIALHDWSYSKDAVIAIIEENFEKPDNSTYGTIEGSLSKKNGILEEHFEVPQTNNMYPIYNDFNVPDNYKFLKVRSWYPCFYLEAGIPGFEGIVNMSIPAGDRDLQIYCEQDGQWMMTAITSEWNAKNGMDIDKISAYVYKSGKWSVALTDVPTKSTDVNTLKSYEYVEETGLEVQKHRSFLGVNTGRYGRIIDVLKNMNQVIYQIDVEIYPGVEYKIPELPPFGCRNAQFNLYWDNPDIDLGFSLIGPSGEEILSSREPGVPTKYDSDFHGDIILPPGNETDLCVERLGECLPGEHYSICVYYMNDIDAPTDFTIKYSWEQNYSRLEGDCLASATEGAVLASILNAPLLYASTKKIPQETLDTLYKLGVENIYLVNIGDYLKSDERNKFKNSFTSFTEYKKYEDIYSYIRKITGSNDVIFSTIDPWSYWYIGDLEIAGEQKGSRFIGPSAYIAAHHGSPVLLIDNHPELSSSVVWHNEFWRRHPDGISKLPTVSEMHLTVTKIYDFLKNLDYDKEGDETIITIGGQFDIGLPWDRIFIGKGKPGRFFGSPTDISTWISKNIFYPMIIFENPVFKNPNGVEMINGSSSKRRFPWRGKIGLKITKPSQEEFFKYPVLDTLVCYEHKFNTRASKYWGFEYMCTDGTIPGKSQSFNPIDEGVMIGVNGEKGGFVADLSGSEVQPFYLKQGGYDPVYSTNFNANMHNLNQGVLFWMVNTHGSPSNGGMFMFWDVLNEGTRGYPPIPLAGYTKETNPWRGYEWFIGSTEEPDTMTSDIHGVLPALAGNPNPIGTRFLPTALDWAAARRPIRDIIGAIASLPLLRFITPDWLQDTEDYYDGVIITVFLGRFGTAWYNGTNIDDALGNIHSAGVSSVACLPAGKYLHLTLMRHGSPFQIMDPWATSWYSEVWQSSVPRGIALGKTIGEIYSEGISKVGIEYISDGSHEWWWDNSENVCLYGDPDLRVWVPSIEFSSNNHWEIEDVKYLRYNQDEGFSIDGHSPFGAENHPYKKEPSSLIQEYILPIILIILLLLIMISFIIFRRKKK